MSKTESYNYQVSINGQILKNNIQAKNPKEAICKALAESNYELVSIKVGTKQNYNAATNLVSSNRKSQNFYLIETQYKIKEQKDNYNSIFDKQYEKLANAFIYLEKIQLGMGDDIKEPFSTYALQANLDYNIWQPDTYLNNKNYPEFNNCKDEQDIIDRMCVIIFTKLLKENLMFIESYIEGYNEYNIYDIFDENLGYEKCKNVKDSKIYKSLELILIFAQRKKMKISAVQPLEDFLHKLLGISMYGINIGSDIGHTYYNYLDTDLFGTVTNSSFTVGHKITQFDIQVHPEFSDFDYVFHKDFNSFNKPRVAICALFKCIDDENIFIDIKLGRYGYIGTSTIAIVGYIKNLKSLTFSIKDYEIDKESYAKKIANIFNDLAIEIINLANQNPELYQNLPKGNPIKYY